MTGIDEEPPPPGEPEPIDSAGPWPFVTRRSYGHVDGMPVVWRSRHHRKGLAAVRQGEPIAAGAPLLHCLWQPRKLNWWIGAVFATGSFLFMLGSVFSLAPGLAARCSLDGRAVNAIFFAGSIPFTTAAYLQLFQSANAREFSPHGTAAPQRPVLFGWRPRDIGWLSSALQFAGTLLFNVNTFDAMVPGLDWLRQDLAIWAPDLAGSVLFLASGYLAFAETCHAHWAWKPGKLSWLITFVNLLGCVAFLASAVFAFVLPTAPDAEAVNISVTFTLIGAAGFLVGSLMLLPETAMQPPSLDEHPNA